MIRKWLIRHFKPSPKFEDAAGFSIKKVDPKQTVFSDGMLTIVYQGRKENTLCSRIYLDGQYDRPVSLEYLANVYSGINMVIYETALHGQVYRYGNHAAGQWELVGVTAGYA